MNNNLNYISEEEMKVIENTEVDKKIQANIQKRKDGIVYRELLNKALDNVRNDLFNGEFIEEYIMGRDYKSDTTRIAVSGTGTYIAHPIFDWSSKLVLIKTNKRLLIMQTAQYFKYLKHYEIEKKVNIYVDNKELYLVLKNLKGREIILETYFSNKEKVINKLQDNDVIIEISKEKFTCVEKRILNKETITFLIAAIILLLIFFYNLATKGLGMWGH